MTKKAVVTEKKTRKRVPVAAPETTPAPRAVRPQLTHELIAKRAYEIWCGKGKPYGTEEQNWIEAEQQLFDEVQGAHTDA